jgi:hypothetical protein
MTLRRTDAAGRGDWIAPRLGSWGTAASITPHGFEAYVRIFHPADAVYLRWDEGTLLNQHPRNGAGGSSAEDDRRRSWAEIAARQGKTVHPLMQWWSILGHHENPRRGDDGWQIGDPATGDVGARSLAVIASILSSYTGTPDDCTGAVWEGFGGIVEEMPWDILPAPELHVPSRTYLMFDCALDDFAGDYWQAPHTTSFPMLNLLWPADRAWFVGSEIDYDSTIVGAPRGAVDELLACPSLETAEVGPDDSLASDADRINRPHPRR